MLAQCTFVSARKAKNSFQPHVELDIPCFKNVSHCKEIIDHVNGLNVVEDELT